MSKIKALIIGVSNYTNAELLSFCENDVNLMKQSLIYGLKLDKDDIFTVGENGIVNKNDILILLSSFTKKINNTDTFIFYFSGHGENFSDGHHILFSDGDIATAIILDFINKIPVDNKIIIIDSCMSGKVNIDQITSNISHNTFDNLGKGCALFLSCSDTQYSFKKPNEQYSLFTGFLCDAIADKLSIRQGKKTLNSIIKLLRLYLDIWNANNPDFQQTPIFRTNINGTVVFLVDEYKPYKVDKFYIDTEKYIIYDVEPLHHAQAKRYSATIILKEPNDLEEIAEINQEIINILRDKEIYNGPHFKALWNGKKANIIFCFFARDKFDVINNNYLCRTTWVDETQDKEYWYSLYKNSKIINDIKFDVHTYYSSLRVFQMDNTGNKEELIIQTKEIITQLMDLANKVINLFNEFLNKTISEEELILLLKPLIPQITNNYIAETQLDIPPIDLKEWSQICSSIAGTVHDFTLYYNEKYLSQRTPQNRKDCMEITIKRYYAELEKLKELDNKV